MLSRCSRLLLRSRSSTDWDWPCVRGLVIMDLAVVESRSTRRASWRASGRTSRTGKLVIVPRCRAWRWEPLTWREPTCWRRILHAAEWARSRTWARTTTPTPAPHLWGVVPKTRTTRWGLVIRMGRRRNVSRTSSGLGKLVSDLRRVRVDYRLREEGLSDQKEGNGDINMGFALQTRYVYIRNDSS